MKVKLNTSLLIAGFRKPLPTGAVVTAVDEIEAKQLIARGFLAETNDKPTHDEFSIKAENEAGEKQRAEAAEQATTIKTTDAEAAAERAKAPAAPAADAKPISTGKTRQGA